MKVIRNSIVRLVVATIIEKAEEAAAYTKSPIDDKAVDTLKTILMELGYYEE